MPGKGLILLMLDMAPELESEFNRWYDDQYVPRMLTVPGILSARRFRLLRGEPKYLTLYELEDLSVLTRPEYRRVSAASPEADAQSRQMFASFQNVTRGVYEQLLTLPDPEPSDLSAAKFLIVRGLDVAPEQDEEFQDWYSTEHIANIARLPGVVRAQRYRLNTEVSFLFGSPAKYLALYDLEALEPTNTEDWSRAINTPWSARMRRFYTARLRATCKRI